MSSDGRNLCATRGIYCPMQDRMRYFGTDGIRGVYGEELTDGLAMLAGNALGRAGEGGWVILGRDTRTSG